SKIIISSLVSNSFDIPRFYQDPQFVLEMKCMDVSIRKFKLKDLAEVIHITEISNFDKTGEFFLKVHKIFPDFFVVPEINGKVVGYTVSLVYPRFSDTGPAFISKLLNRLIHNTTIPLSLRKLFLSNSAFHILTAISPEYRRMGLASAIKTRVLEEMKKQGIKKVSTAIRVTNIPSIKMNKKLGFKEKKHLPDYYGKGTPGILLERDL
ncbi:MAG: GNAT family N-acetyltransferase, partial [Promethearchaeota archaeon]